jgi:hypothetical protein
MSPLSWIAAASVVVALTLVLTSVFVVRLLIQLRRTAAEVEQTMRQAQPVLTEAQAVIHEMRGTAGALSSTVIRLDRFVGSLEHLGSHAARASSMISGIGGPVGQATAIWTAVKTGAGIFQRIVGRNHKKPREHSVEAAESAARDL